MVFTLRRYLVPNDTMSVVSKSNKCKTCSKKITNPLTIERHVLVDNYFCTHVSRLLDFDTNDMVSFDTKYFFIHFMIITLYYQIKKPINLICFMCDSINLSGKVLYRQIRNLCQLPSPYSQKKKKKMISIC